MATSELISPSLLAIGSLFLNFMDYPLDIWGIFLLISLSGLIKGMLTNKTNQSSNRVIPELTSILNTLIIFVLLLVYLHKVSEENQISILLLGSFALALIFKQTFHLISYIIGLIIS